MINHDYDRLHGIAHGVMCIACSAAAKAQEREADEIKRLYNEAKEIAYEALAYIENLLGSDRHDSATLTQLYGRIMRMPQHYAPPRPERIHLFEKDGRYCLDIIGTKEHPQASLSYISAEARERDVKFWESRGCEIVRFYGSPR